ncbi:hypothetical protein ACFSMW_02630 [Virgibacillus halophilus]|uniref:Ferric reductase like transmembrane component n=1 Tax=Tigheibacillus halophilus TaxID=361280 RepID=A0ABU5CAV3_9BACI|nr:hypothetical protein [Virgibacillus halophilus]
MSKWFYLNFGLFVIAVWKIIGHALHTTLTPSIWIGFMGLAFFLFNWTRHAVFSTIRSHPRRETKIRLARISKKVVPYHRYMGTTALLLVVIHAVSMFYRYGFVSRWPKMWMGLIAAIILLFMVLSGWLRLFWPSVKKRYLHIYLGMLLFFLIFIHIIL